MARPLISLPTLDDKSSVMALAKTAKKSAKATPTVKGGGGIATQIADIKAAVLKNLGKYEDETLLIRDAEALHDYISLVIENGMVAIDTETTGLDPMLDECVGISLYTEGQKPCYVPINHISYITMEKSPNQLSVETVKNELDRLIDVKIIMFNATFDIRVIRNQIGSYLSCYWDCSIGAKLLNENEDYGEGGLKALHKKYVLNGQGDAFAFDALFKGVKFNLVPINVGYLYAAHDAIITWELYEFQKQYLRYDSECKFEDRNGLNGIAWTFFNIEMPCINVVADMEDTGVALNVEYARELSIKYNAILDSRKNDFYTACEEYSTAIEKYRLEYPDVKLDTPINISSPKQLEVLLYDIIGLDAGVDKRTKKPIRGTGEEVIIKFDNDVCRAILAHREIEKLINTYIDKLPNTLNPNDHRVHGKFNQYGAKCIVGDSLVLTNWGYVPIADLFDGTETEDASVSTDITVVNALCEYEQASHRVMYKEKPTVKLKLRGGFVIEGTPNHPIVCSSVNKLDIQRNKSERQIKHVAEQCGFRRLENVQKGDLVRIPLGYNLFPNEYIPTNFSLGIKQTNAKDCKLPEVFTEDFAELLGMYFADGSIHDSCGQFSIRVSNKDMDVINRVCMLVRNVFGLSATVVSTRTTVDTCFGSVRISCIQQVLGRGARNKYIPKEIMQSPKSVVCAFIRGTTLDSSYDSNRQRLSISYWRKDSAEFVHQVLANMGILSSLTLQTNHGVHYRLNIVGENYKKFLNVVGVVQSSKRDIRNSYKPSQYLISGDSYFAYVEDIEYGVNDVYDLTVPKTHSFIANGIVNHNTGRFSSSEPNLQNIPSHNKDIRPMFVASDGYVMMSSDFSQQEPKALAALCRKDGDSQMYDTFMQGKDLYSEIASKAFNVPYEACREFNVDGSTNKEGKERRTQAKSILLGVLYGRGEASIAEQLGCSVDKAKAIKESVFRGFPAIKEFEQRSLDMAKSLGYVTTVCGRKRRLPELQLPEYSFEWEKGYEPEGDILDFDDLDVEVPIKKQNYYISKLRSVYKWEKKQAIIADAKKEHIVIVNNGGKIAEATRQCVNARIQGSAADLTKLAMIRLYNNKRLKELGFRILIQVHDEIIAECKEENLKECSELLASTMSEAAEKVLGMPIKCDVECSRAWYGEKVEVV